jgi:hypothetical protein
VTYGSDIDIPYEEKIKSIKDTILSYAIPKYQKMSNKIKPNQYEEAKQELSKLNLGSFELPTEMQANESSYYYVVGINETPNPKGLGVITTAKMTFYDQLKWQQMTKEVAKEKPLYRVVGGGVFKAVVILHNPTLPLHVEKKEYVPKPLTDEQKAEAQKLYSEGVTLRPMSQQLDVKEKDLKPYFESLKNNQ